MTASPATVDEYIAGFPPDVQVMLRAVREAVRRAAPEADERISYRMPALFQNGAVVHYGAFKKHLGLFPPVAEPSLRMQAARFAGPKGNLQFPYSEALPLDLIARVVQARVASNAARAGAQVARPRKPAPATRSRGGSRPA